MGGQGRRRCGRRLTCSGPVCGLHGPLLPGRCHPRSRRCQAQTLWLCRAVTSEEETNRYRELLAQAAPAEGRTYCSTMTMEGRVLVLLYYEVLLTFSCYW